MKIIIAGAGEAGTYLSQLLYKADNNIVILDTNKAQLEYLDSHHDFLTLFGSATSIEDLKKAGVETAALFIALMPSEEVNILACTLAKRLGAKKVIARIDNKEYLENNNEQFFKDLGIDSLIYPEILASEEIVGLMERVGVNKSFSFAGGKLSLFALKIKSKSPVLNQSLSEITKNCKGFDFRAVAIHRKGKTLIPKGSDKLYHKDMLYVICKPEASSEAIRLAGRKQFKVEKVMILGGSRIGVKTALQCEKTADVKLIESDLKKCERIAEILNTTMVLNGDGRDTELLKEEGIANVDVFIAVTGNTETNILACLHAKKMGVPKTIVEVENTDYVSITEEMDIESVINKKTIAAGHIYSHIMNENVSTVQCLVENEAEILEYTVNEKSKIAHKAIRELKFPEKAIIGGLTRNGQPIIAKGDTTIEPGDCVVIFSLPEAIKKVDTFFLNKK